MRHLLPTRWSPLVGDLRLAVGRDNLVLMAAGVAFFALLAVVPALAAVVALWSLFAQPADATRVVEQFATSLPPSAQQTIDDQLQAVIRSSDAGLGLTAAVGLVVALWSASSAVKYLLQAVASVYGQSAAGRYVRLRGLALVATLGAILFALVAVALITALPATLARLELGTPIRITVSWLRWPLLTLSMLGALTVLYRIAAPHVRPSSWLGPGALTATAIWVTSSAGFAWYAANFGNFNQTYGSMAGVVVLMFWFFLSALAVMIGAEVDVATGRILRLPSGETGP